MLITHTKLQPMQCYHIFSDDRNVYLSKNCYEHYSPRMVPVAKISGAGSWPIGADVRLSHYSTLIIVGEGECFVTRRVFCGLQQFTKVEQFKIYNLPYRSVVSCARLTTSPCHIFLSLLLSLLVILLPMVFVMSIVQTFLGWSRDLLPSIFPSISCSWDALCLIRWLRYCNFLALNCLTISLPVPIRQERNT